MEIDPSKIVFRSDPSIMVSPEGDESLLQRGREFSERMNVLRGLADAAKHADPPVEICIVCGFRIETMCFKGTGVCSEQHRKLRDGEPVRKRH